MTKKDFQLIADAIARVKGEDGLQTRDLAVLCWAATCLAFALRKTNPRFEKARFMAACGFPAEK